MKPVFVNYEIGDEIQNQKEFWQRFWNEWKALQNLTSSRITLPETIKSFFASPQQVNQFVRVVDRRQKSPSLILRHLPKVLALVIKTGDVVLQDNCRIFTETVIDNTSITKKNKSKVIEVARRVPSVAQEILKPKGIIASVLNKKTWVDVLEGEDLVKLLLQESDSQRVKSILTPPGVLQKFFKTKDNLVSKLNAIHWLQLILKAQCSVDLLIECLKKNPSIIKVFKLYVLSNLGVETIANASKEEIKRVTAISVLFSPAEWNSLLKNIGEYVHEKSEKEPKTEKAELSTQSTQSSTTSSTQSVNKLASGVVEEAKEIELVALPIPPAAEIPVVTPVIQKIDEAEPGATQVSVADAVQPSDDSSIFSGRLLKDADDDAFSGRLLNEDSSVFSGGLIPDGLKTPAKREIYDNNNLQFVTPLKIPDGPETPSSTLSVWDPKRWEKENNEFVSPGARGEQPLPPDLKGKDDPFNAGIIARKLDFNNAKKEKAQAKKPMDDLRPSAPSEFSGGQAVKSVSGTGVKKRKRLHEEFLVNEGPKSLLPAPATADIVLSEQPKSLINTSNNHSKTIVQESPVMRRVVEVASPKTPDSVFSGLGAIKKANKCKQLKSHSLVESPRPLIGTSNTPKAWVQVASPRTPNSVFSGIGVASPVRLTASPCSLLVGSRRACRPAAIGTSQTRQQLQPV